MKTICEGLGSHSDSSMFGPTMLCSILLCKMFGSSKSKAIWCTKWLKSFSFLREPLRLSITSTIDWSMFSKSSEFKMHCNMIFFQLTCMSLRETSWTNMPSFTKLSRGYYGNELRNIFFVKVMITTNTSMLLSSINISKISFIRWWAINSWVHCGMGKYLFGPLVSDKYFWIHSDLENKFSEYYCLGYYSF